MFLFKIWILDINFTALLFLLAGIAVGAILVGVTYLILVLASLRDEKRIIEAESTISEDSVSEMIKAAKEQFSDKELRGDLTKTSHCKNICVDLVYGIASKLFPSSKYPLLEITVDEALMMITYIEQRIELILNKKAIRLLKKLKISSVVNLTKKTSTVLDSKAVEVTKELKKTSDTFFKVLNFLNPAYWIKKGVIDTTVNVSMNKICLLVIEIVGQEAYKIYSKRVFIDTELSDDEINYKYLGRTKEKSFSFDKDYKYNQNYLFIKFKNNEEPSGSLKSI